MHNSKNIAFEVSGASSAIDSMNIKSDIGARIKARRRAIKISQEELSDYTDIGSTTLSRLEQGKANITIETLGRVLDVLGLEIKLDIKQKGLK